MKIFRFNIKINRTWLIILLIIIAIVGYFIIKNIFKSPLDSYLVEKVSFGEVSQEIFETGNVKATEDINLSFKAGGKIARINVAAGNDVNPGDILAELDTNQTSAQLQNARAALDVAVSQYNKLQNGLTSEDIKIYENAVSSAKHDLDSANDSAINTLNDAYTKIYNAYTAITTIQNSYFSIADQEGIKVQDARKDINDNLQNAKNYLDPSETSKMILALNNVYRDLGIIRDQCDLGVYYTKVSSADKTILDNQKEYINTATESVTTSQKNIATYEIALQKANDDLALKTANARPEDIDIYKAQINQAQANVNLYQSQLGDNYLRSPINGKVTKVNAKRGEIVNANESVINLLSSEPFQIKVDIYEQDIVNVKVSDIVKITLVAFPKQTFEGKVLSIDPAEKIVDNVVYYEVTVDFPGQPEAVKSGMTADVVILTNKKENVLRVPKNVVEIIDGKEFLQIANKGKIENREVVTGLEGNDYFEIVSGLSAGDTIIIGKK